jgi:RNA polymerase sigma-70 factor (ECF subfamily)
MFFTRRTGVQPEPRSILEQISTRWSEVGDPIQFVYRYGPAVRAYLAALVADPHDAEDVTQDFLLRMLRQPTLTPERVRRGRFRDYLKAALRNVAADHFRRKCGHARAVAGVPELVPAATEPSADSAYDLEWQKVLLDRCWDALEAQERASADNLGYSVLKLTVDRPDADSAVLAAELSARVGRAITPETFRKQRSRARKAFAQFLVNEVRQTLAAPTSGAVVEELTELGLLEYVREYLPRGG